MNKYISKEYIRNIVQNHLDDSCGAECYAYSCVLDEIDNIPATYVIEVAHGHWEAAGFDGHGDYKECCSECKSWSIGRDKEYCPVCGAKNGE